jgi:hypothetical protein
VATTSVDLDPSNRRKNSDSPKSVALPLQTYALADISYLTSSDNSWQVHFPFVDFGGEVFENSKPSSQSNHVEVDVNPG